MSEAVKFRAEIINMIDQHKNTLINPVEMLNWVWLRVFLLQIPEDDLVKYFDKTSSELSK